MAVIGSLGTSLAACSTTGSPFAPRSFYSIDTDINDFHEKFASATSIKDYYDQGAETVERRNAFIAGRITLYDLEYIRFVSSFRLSRAAQSSAFDGIALGVGLATTLVGPARTKTVLGAISTALTGARASYEKNFYDDKTSVVLVAQMNAERKSALLALVQGAQQRVAEYPLSKAIVDLANYQFAGTVDGALGGIQRDASVKDVVATAALERYRNYTFSLDESSTILDNWLFPGAMRIDAKLGPVTADGNQASIDADHLAILTKEIAALGLDGLNVLTFISNPALAEQRATVVKKLGLK